MGVHEWCVDDSRLGKQNSWLRGSSDDGQNTSECDLLRDMINDVSEKLRSVKMVHCVVIRCAWLPQQSTRHPKFCANCAPPGRSYLPISSFWNEVGCGGF